MSNKTRVAIRYQTIALFVLLFRCQLLFCHGHDATLRGGQFDSHDELLHPHPLHNGRSLGEEYRNEDGIPICGFPDPSVADLNELKASDDDTSFLRRFIKFAVQLGRGIRRIKKNVPTYYHIIQNATIAGPSSDLVREQHAHLVEAFASTGFTFTLKDITFTNDNDWFSYTQYNTVQEREMKTTLRRGGAESLNIYVNNGKGVCGYAYLPKFYSQFNWNDGIVINFRCFLGASQSQEGDVVVHEVVRLFRFWRFSQYLHLLNCLFPFSAGSLVGFASHGRLISC